MNKAMAIVVAVLAAFPAMSLFAGDGPDPNLESDFGLFCEARDVKREINLHNLYNGLHLSVEQMEKIVELARKACDLREKCFGGDNYRCRQIVQIYREILETVREGDRIPASLEGMGGVMEIAEKRIRKRYFEGMSELEASVWNALTPAQREVFKTYDPCLIPPKTLRDPVRVGQASTYDEEKRVLDLARGLTDAAFEKECRKVLSAMIGGLEQFLGAMEAAEREAEIKRMVEVCRKARKLSEMDFALKCDEIAEELAIHRQKDVLKHKAEEFMDLVRKFQGGLIGKIANHFLDPMVIPLMTARIERAKNAPAHAARDLKSEESPEDGRCGRNPGEEKPAMKRKYGFDEICREIGLDGEPKGAMKAVLSKAKAAHIKVMQTPMADGTTPLSRFMAIQAMPPEKREAAAADMFQKLGEPVPGRDSSFMEYILWIKIGLDRQFKKMLTREQYDKLYGLVEDPLDNIDLDGGSKPTIEEISRKLMLNQALAKMAGEEVRKAQGEAWAVLSIPDDTGKKPLDCILAISGAADDAQKQKNWAEFMQSLSRKIPQRQTTYGEELDKIKARVDAAFKKAFSPEQYEKFRQMAVDVLDIQAEE